MLCNVSILKIYFIFLLRVEQNFNRYFSEYVCTGVCSHTYSFSFLKQYEQASVPISHYSCRSPIVAVLSIRIICHRLLLIQTPDPSVLVYYTSSHHHTPRTVWSFRFKKVHFTSTPGLVHKARSKLADLR